MLKSRMTDPLPNSFDIFTDSEATRMETVMAELDAAPWAQSLLHAVRRDGGFVRENMARFFELRCGHALHKADVALEYEVPGEGASRLDFGFTSKGQPWKVEIMRLSETEAAKAATTTGADGDFQWKRRILSSGNEDKKQSTEGEALKAIERICQKCVHEGRPHKFPKPDNSLHAILVDMRNYKDGGDMHDRLHIGLGGEYVKEPFRMYWKKDEKSEPVLISGVFGSRTKEKGATEARERVHFIGFVRERTFQDGELRTAMQFVANPLLLKDAGAIKAAIDTWPLQPAQILNGIFRRRSGLKLPIEPDPIWPGMWRVRLPNGQLSDMVNLTRANDAAVVLARNFQSRVEPAAA